MYTLPHDSMLSVSHPVVLFVASSFPCLHKFVNGFSLTLYHDPHHLLTPPSHYLLLLARWPPYRLIFNGSYCTAEGHFCQYSIHVCRGGQVSYVLPFILCITWFLQLFRWHCLSVAATVSLSSCHSLPCRGKRPSSISHVHHTHPSLSGDGYQVAYRRSWYERSRERKLTCDMA